MIDEKDILRTKEEMQAHIDKLTSALDLAKTLVDAQNSIIEALRAQLIIQDMHLGKLNETLQVKEKVKDDDRCHTMEWFPSNEHRLLSNIAS